MKRHRDHGYRQTQEKRQGQLKQMTHPGAAGMC
jgi:hypothetical protein